MSITKSQIKFVSGLKQKKQRDLEKKFIVEGIKIVTDLFEQDKFVVATIFYTSEFKVDIPVNIEAFEVSDRELERISGLKSPNKVLAIVEYPKDEELDLKTQKFIVVLDDIKDPGNLGTVIRTAEWFGADAILTSDGSVDLFNPKVNQASMGAIFRINVIKGEISKFINDLKENEFSIVGAVLDGTNLYSYNFPNKIALVIGSESHGISENTSILLDDIITIPKYGEMESLNLAMSAGILMSEYRRQIGE